MIELPPPLFADGDQVQPPAPYSKGRVTRSWIGERSGKWSYTVRIRGVSLFFIERELAALSAVDQLADLVP